MASHDVLLDAELNEERYIDLLTKLIGESEHVQNNPPKFVPQEDKVIQHLLEALRPYSTENGGPLQVEHVTYVPGRGNLIIKYMSEGAKGIVSFVGSHLDVVPANPETWDRNPFKLVREDDKLYGRGTTDCLGHVALITELFIQLAEKKVQLNTNMVAIFIACEENSTIPDVGVDKLLKDGRLDELKGGPVYWVDSADSQPCVGTAAAIVWNLHAKGHLFHSGLPHNGINSFEFANEAVAYLQKRFYEDFPAHEKEDLYQFATPSTMKPTQVRIAEGSFNQLPPWTKIIGDIRLTPFYNVEDVMSKIKTYVDELNATDFAALPTRGPCSKYVVKSPEGEDIKGVLTLEFEGEPFKGIACDLESDGHHMLRNATKEVLGKAEPFSICGSLPLVGDLQEAGFDVQVCGYGHSSVYHGDNEYCSVSAMKNAIKIMSRVIHGFSSKYA
ncbi:uncharacterized protein LOC135805072 [Sycon ciliatum]|uniref:uncharacterized protein LOC135805072 n=1 Tax=Sycon ciliatum TaxID=27933 RepID=UPI0031F5F4FE